MHEVIIDPVKTDLLQCPYCGHKEFDVQASLVRCRGCNEDFPVVHGIVNTLKHPSPDVEQEMRGMMVEWGRSDEAIQDVMVREVDYLPTLEEKQRLGADEPMNYYVATEMNFCYAFGKLNLAGTETVLEVGSSDPYQYLEPFRDRGCRCVAANIYYAYDKRDANRTWPEKYLGDMNRLPFKDETFDIILFSATTHHSPDLDNTVSEAARVLKPGGTMVVINEPTYGVFKYAAARFDRRFSRGKGREVQIHENEYTMLAYRKAYRKHGLRLKESFFSVYYDHKLAAMRTAGVRFAVVAGFVSRLWRRRFFRETLKTYGLAPGQLLFGLELNTIVEKMHQDRPHR